MEAPIPPWELVSRLGDDEVVVVDCRSAEERQLVPLQIPGAVMMSVEDIRSSPWVLPDDELVIVYDGGDQRCAPRAARALLSAGRRAVVLDGGIRGWLEAGYPAERIRSRPAISDDARSVAATHG